MKFWQALLPSRPKVNLAMKTSEFDYNLPPELIAQGPAEPRDSSRLLVLDRATQTWQHRHFFDIGDFLRPGDLLVVNESKVFKARLMAKTSSGSPVEIFLLRPEEGVWIALAKPGKKLAVGDIVTFEDERAAKVLAKLDDGTVRIDLGRSADEVFAWADTIGQVPLPPYIATPKSKDEDYQTVYAKNVGSVAAPTAGFHFTPRLLEELKTNGIRIATVTLHVGLGTFRPIKTETLEEHEMHREWVDVPDETLRLIEQTKKKGGRVIAVGTTSVRALESGMRHGFTDIFITPGYQFNAIDGMITNFHLPKSTLLVLVSAFAGKQFVLNAYTEAVQRRYRFYSFGDAMLII